ncbi:hypothetical protein [Candidatus Symbiobacter mobilis]|uniref:Uncharacterized protein n=1 Tax=Candidatus Symbiobacter mobilis CR TaxID=946483 RepID=U5N8I8_9BURK|nr:hypothetical protein [Candidatus Symbiobacter mobilis]AGX87635.1 hypothetical protein Cenrod_1550 [Candidatus Symbiobacter mobilis CR]
MSETKKRKVHTAKYKAKVGLEALRNGEYSGPAHEDVIGFFACQDGCQLPLQRLGLGDLERGIRILRIDSAFLLGDPVAQVEVDQGVELLVRQQVVVDQR